MPGDPEQSLRDAVCATHDRYKEEAETAGQARREAFAKAQADGLTVRQIGEIAADTNAFWSSDGILTQFPATAWSAWRRSAALCGPLSTWMIRPWELRTTVVGRPLIP